MDRNHRIANQVYRSPDYFILKASGLRLRTYQREVLNAVIRSIREKAGRSFVVIFARQSGKNELQAQLFVYLLAVLSRFPLNIVSVSPTFKPQALVGMERLEKVLSRNLFTRNAWHRKDGFKYCVGSSQVVFLSGNPSASVVGQTAHILLSVDEAQAFVPIRFDKIFSPMAAANNATRIFWGTSWTSATLLSRERRLAEAAQAADGLRRVWIVPGDVVARESSSYAGFLEGEIARMGRDHPIIRSQYFCEEIDAQSGMFNTARQALMQGDQNCQSSAVDGQVYSFLLDVAGQDEVNMNILAESYGPCAQAASSRHAPPRGHESAGLTNPGRDSVSLTIASIDLSTLGTLQAPTYRLVNRQQWTGQNHLVIFGKLKSLVESWKPQHIVLDATGVGEGLWAMLDKAFPGRVIPVKFTRHVKSELGWKFLSIIETGRLRDCTRTATSGSSTQCLPQEGQTPTYDKVLAQYIACQSEVLPGPGQVLRWGVPEGARGPDRELIHDDFLMADALVAVLDRLDWHVRTDIFIGEGYDPLENIR